MVRPTTCDSRPRRTTSTSGSSGTGVGVAGGDDRDVSGLRCLLLGFLLRAAGAVTVELVADLHLGREDLLVIRPLVLDDVLRDSEGVLRGELLKTGLPVEPGTEPCGVLHQWVEEQVHDLARSLEAAAEVDSPDHRLDGVGEDRGLLAAPGRLLSSTELDVPPEVDGLCTSASARALTTAARSSASRPSDRSG